MSVRKIRALFLKVYGTRRYAERSLSIALVFALVCMSLQAVAQEGTTAKPSGAVAYRDPNLPVEKRVDDLLSRMTLEEKIGQMCQYTDNEVNGEELARRGLAGSLENVISPGKMEKIQRAAVSESRLGIPVLFAIDVIHGYSTIFPIPLGEASTWDPSLVEKCAAAAATEAHSQGIRWTFSPMVDIARDPRWGRIAEGAGEDPYLGMVMAKAQVEGYQGEKLSTDSKLVACAKHYVAYGAAEGGRDYNTVDVSERTLREIYLPPFKATVDAGVGTVMSAFDDIDGVPATANPLTIREILKGEWSFKGFVVSDWDAVAELINHGVACDSSEAAMKAVNAGVDMDMIGPYHDKLQALVNEGKVSMQVVDDAVRRILKVKFDLGLFENPYVDVAQAKSSLLRKETLELARKEAREAVVLLKNDGNLLPLSKTTKSIAVIGPLADDKEDMLGTWHCQGKPEPVTTVLEGIKSEISDGTKLFYASGCGIDDTSKAGFQQALEIARESDVTILVVGESDDMSGEAASRSSLDLPGVQENLVEQVASLGKPVVEIVVSGRPLAISWSAEHVPAILESWFLGTEAGNAISDVLFGDFDPCGKLAATFPRNVGQVPVYYDHMNTGRPGVDTSRFTSKYIDLPLSPLYPFGYGLSYTHFSYSNLRVENDPSVQDQFRVAVELTNTGNVEGAEVAQLYVRQPCASVTRPVKQLAGFSRVELQPGESKTIHFVLTPYELSFINSQMKRVVESGDIQIMVGGNSVDVVSTKAHIDSAITVSEETEIQ